MHAEQNKVIVRRFYEELWNERRVELVEELIAADCVTHQLSSGAELTGVARGPEAMKRHVAEWLASFPDLRFTVEQALAEGDHVITRSVMRGTHMGDWLGVAPTGKRVAIRMIVIQRIADGKIAEDWVLVESLGLLQQLGLVPPTGDILQRH
ncbi:MAG: ester cyclase [Acidobacteriota bacterium]|nr:ester cyclase [Acidobacteriota bacterium]